MRRIKYGRQSQPDYIEQVSCGFLDTLLLDGGKTECRGRFLCHAGDEYYIAVNNTLGQRWRQEFRNLTTAALWLRGHWCLNIRNELCDGLTGEIIYDIAERVRAESERE